MSIFQTSFYFAIWTNNERKGKKWKRLCRLHNRRLVYKYLNEQVNVWRSIKKSHWAKKLKSFTSLRHWISYANTQAPYYNSNYTIDRKCLITTYLRDDQFKPFFIFSVISSSWTPSSVYSVGRYPILTLPKGKSSSSYVSGRSTL